MNISFSCCQSDRLLDFVPISCFEQNGCRGLQWLGDEACAPSILNSIEDKKLGKTPQTNLETITKEPILEQSSTVNSRFKKVHFSFLKLFDLRKIYVVNLNTGCQKKYLM